MLLDGSIQGFGLIVSLFVTLCLTAYGIRQYQQRGYESHLIAFIGHMGTLSGIILTELCFWVVSPELERIGLTVVFPIGGGLAGATFLWFVGTYAHPTQWPTRWVGGITVGVPIVLVLGGLFGPAYLSTPIDWLTDGPIATSGVAEPWLSLDGALGATVWFIGMVGHGLVVFGIGMLTQLSLRHRNGLFSGQTMAVAIGASAPLLTTGLSMSGTIPPELRLSGIGYGLTGVGFAIAIFRYRLLAVTPIARHRLLAELTDPVIRLDHESRVVDCNPAAIELVDAPQEWCGMPATEFFSSLLSTVRQGLLAEPPQTELSVEASDMTRYFAPVSRSVESSRRNADDRLLILREITTQKHRELELDQHNERLEQFAQTVAHELQNPLNVAQAHVKLIRDRDHNEHLGAIETAHDRMEQLIDDVLTLAHVDDTVEKDSNVHLAAVARAATQHIDLTDCDCEILIPPSTTVYGNEDQLRRVFENLYQNATLHNDSAVTIRVGLLADPETQSTDQQRGFFVEDTGKGIPEKTRTKVIERGYTTHSNGTGFGLWIVTTIVQAHGWEIDITESADGGARFEITGIDRR